MMFYIGQKVICIDVSDSLYIRLRRWLFPPLGGDIELNGIYTVASVIIHNDGDPRIELFEVRAPECAFWKAGFLARCFRPLIERETSIEIFQTMLVPSPREKVRAE